MELDKLRTDGDTIDLNDGRMLRLRFVRGVDGVMTPATIGDMTPAEAKREQIRSGFEISLRWGDEPWFLAMGAKTVSKHATKAQAIGARTRMVNAIMRASCDENRLSQVQ